MVYNNISWANVCRRAKGEQLRSFCGQIVTEEYVEKQLNTLTPKQLQNKKDAYQRELKKRIFQILELPEEIRENILEQTIEQDTIAVFLPGRNGQRPKPIPLPDSANKLNHQLRLEALRIILMRVTIEVHSGPGNQKFQNWLASLDFKPLPNDMQNGFDAVKKLKFPYFSRFPHHLPNITQNNDLMLATRCRNLRELTLNFVSFELFDHQTGVEKTADTLRQQYFLDSILTLDHLEVLRFTGFCSDDQGRGIRALGAWFEEEFKTQKEGGKQSGCG